MNKYLIGAVIVGVIAAGAWYINQDRAPGTDGEVTDRPQTDETGDPGAESVEVVFTDTGYAPTEIRVKAGTAVVFKNQSSVNMWTASNPHPVHTILPALDARRNILPGESYSFTFTQAGTWNYHDHNTARFGGTVVVE